MSNKPLYDQVSSRCSKYITNAYSTSFSLGIKLLSKEIRAHIYNIYGFVRVADEIVDTFLDYPNEELFHQFKQDTYWALDNKISTNPILNCFQETVLKYKIDYSLIDQFLKSMEMDLSKSDYSREQFDEYVLGSAEVVGLMCLKVFVFGDDKKYEALKPFAMKLGAAFQKINFLRDLKQDTEDLGRTYFPELQNDNFDLETKLTIEREIADDFEKGLIGIKMLPKESRFGVYLAYKYYLRLFKKISRLDISDVMSERIRIPNEQKASILLRSYLRHSFNIL